MMDRKLNREILRLSVPSILANISVPLVGFVDTAISGHLFGVSAAAAIGAVSVGSMFLSLLYWNFAFLRAGTGGLTAQAYGAGDDRTAAKMLWRGLGVALGVAIALLALQLPFLKLATLVTHASAEVTSLAQDYFLVRIWAAPATLSLQVFSGWFVGEQDSISSMWKDLVVNGVNIAASIVLSKRIGFNGIALGTVIAQYCGLLFCIAVAALKYRRLLSSFPISELKHAFTRDELLPYLKMNGNLFVRSLCFMVIYLGYTLIAARLGDQLLACSSVMMQLLMLFSYFTDGFAYAGEALTGRFIGAGDRPMMHRSVRYVFVWSMTIACLFIGLYHLGGVPVLRLLTDDASVVAACSRYLWWLLIMPPLGCAAFTWDGIFLGAACTRPVRDSMIVAMLSFLAVWFAGELLFQPSMDLLLAAYFAHLAARTIWLSACWKKIA